MTTNTVLECAIESQVKARAMLVKCWGVPPDDVDDVCQQALLRILMANPRNIEYPRSYWYKTLRTAAVDYWRRRCRQPVPFSLRDGDGELARDREDLRQDVDRQAEVAEVLRQVRDICRAATPKERGAVTALIRAEHMDNAKRQRLHHLRKRLRAAVA